MGRSLEIVIRLVYLNVDLRHIHLPCLIHCTHGRLRFEVCIHFASTTYLASYLIKPLAFALNKVVCILSLVLVCIGTRINAGFSSETWLRKQKHVSSFCAHLQLVRQRTNWCSVQIKFVWHTRLFWETKLDCIFSYLLLLSTRRSYELKLIHTCQYFNSFAFRTSLQPWHAFVNDKGSLIFFILQWITSVRDSRSGN